VKAEQLGCIKKRIAGGNYRENAQANDRAGWVEASVLGLESDDKADRHPITRMIRAWIAAGSFRSSRKTDTRKPQGEEIHPTGSCATR
jgi:hypothetical protein